MATSLIPDLPPLKPTRPIDEVLRDIYEAYDSNTRDMDKSSEQSEH